jgi:hypothetical protein
MPDLPLSDANQAARELREELNAPRWAINVTAWVKDGKTSLMVWVDPKFAGKIEIPQKYHRFKVDTRRKLPIKAESK